MLTTRRNCSIVGNCTQCERRLATDEDEREFVNYLYGAKNEMQK